MSPARAVFVYTPSLGFILLCWEVFFFSIPATWQARIYSTCVREARMTASSLEPIDVSPSFLLVRSSDVQLSVSTSKADETETAELERRRSLDASLPVGSRVQRP